MKNEVRPIDANATIEALRANFQQGSWYGCEEPGYQIAEDTISEMPTLTDHFREATKMMPLTMEQLQEMDGQPVWVEDKQMPELSGWGIMRDDVCDGYYGVCFIEEYGKRWIAYAYPPAHIDREEWDGCPICGKY